MGTLSIEEKRKVRKPLLWVGIASIVMTFAGLTSGYVVSRSALRVENMWLEFALPPQFYWATAVMLLSSFTIIWAKRSAKRNDQTSLRAAVLITLLLGITFAVLQWYGAVNLRDRGLFFTGLGSSTSVSWVYVIAFLHWAHVISGIIVLIVTYSRALIGAYSPKDHHGLDISAIYWHFLDGLWVYLFLFMVFIR